MISRNIQIVYGNSMVETTPFNCDIDRGGEKTVGFGLSVKNITDADCVGDIKLIFLTDESYEFFQRKLSEAKKMKDEEVSKQGSLI